MITIPNLSFVQISLTLANRAISELKIIREFEQYGKAEIINGPPFGFYELSLQYMFIMEITKLLEKPNKKRSEEHMGSIEKASETILDKGIVYCADNQTFLVEELKNIRESNLFIYLKELRNKKFAHSDENLEIDPLEFPILNSDQIADCIDLLTKLFDVWKCITVALGYDFDSKVPCWDDRTAIFLKNHSVYKLFYFDHQKEANSKGYSL